MSRTTTRVAAGTAIATAGLFWSVPLITALAAADNTVSPGGVPCISILQNAITNPPDLSGGLPAAANSIFNPGSPTVGVPIPPASAVGSVPVPPATVPGAPGTLGTGGVVIPPASVPGAPGTAVVGGVPTPPAAVPGTPPAAVTGAWPGSPAAVPGTPPGGGAAA